MWGWVAENERSEYCLVLTYTSVEQVEETDFCMAFPLRSVQLTIKEKLKKSPLAKKNCVLKDVSINFHFSFY